MARRRRSIVNEWVWDMRELMFGTAIDSVIRASDETRLPGIVGNEMYVENKAKYGKIMVSR
jgi:hypothetical protein